MENVKTPWTPGAWGAIEAPYRDDGSWAVVNPIRQVAVIGDGDDRVRQNAALIAAAPEMAEALAAFVKSDKMLGWTEGDCDNWLGPIWHKAAAALRKAGYPGF